MELKGAVAIVTGCTGGLGQRICRVFAENGVQVAGVYQHSKEQAEVFAKEWSALGPRCIAIQADDAACGDPAHGGSRWQHTAG
jgi:3-oxoacyl-[acyl-carrier protein] reductase